MAQMRAGHTLRCASNYGPAPCDCAPAPWPQKLEHDDPALAWAAGIAARIAEFSPDERRVLERIVQGIEKGREVYGPMDLANETRDLIAEADDECRDWLIYRAMQRIRSEKP